MNQLIPYLIKSTSILLILLVYYRLFLRKQTFFRLNRAYLLSALLIAIVTPFISFEIKEYILTPEPQHPVKVYMSNLLEEVHVFGNYTHTSDFPVAPGSFSPLALVYGLGVMVFICRYILANLQILRIIRRYPGKRFHGIRIVLLPPGQPAFSYFGYLFICPDLPRDDRRKIFEHEKIHIRECHSLDLLIAEIICISNWFNPLVWILKNTIMENHEYIADRQAIQRFHTGSYLELLIRQTLKGAFSLTNYFSCTNLKKRTIMMTRKQSCKYWVLSFIPVTAILVTLLYGFSCNKTTEEALPLVIPSMSGPAEGLTTDSLKKATKDLFVVVDEMPQFPGKITSWIGANTKYPPIAIEKGIQGKVYVNFIIEKDGSVSGIKVVRGVDPSLDEEAIRLVRSMPKWKPGKQRGQDVRVSYTLPIRFALSTGATAKADSVIVMDLFKPGKGMPVFPEGNINRWVSRHVQYPPAAIAQKIEGKVYVQFIIEKDGSTSSAKVLKSASPELNQEALRVVNSMPRWKPAQKDGKNVRVSMTLPIHFHLSQ